MTNLDPASPRRARFVDSLTSDGHLCSTRWQDAFRAVPREQFVTQFTVPSRNGLTDYDRTDTQQHDEALDAIYGDHTLITQWDRSGTATSSSSTPSLMADMLEHLDAWPGHHVLEVGTGTGYNAALLCHALGGQTVTSVDIHGELVDQAADRLGELGFAPLVEVADGRAGAPQHGPYDRIIATCGFDRVPPAWLPQLVADAVVVVNLGFGLAVLTGGPNGLAGRFVESAAFMSARSDASDTSLTARDVLAAINHADTGNTEESVAPGLDPETFLSPPVGFLRKLHCPHLHYVLTTDDDDTSTYHLYDPIRASWSRATLSGDRATVTTHGRDLWQDLLDVVTSWHEHGRRNLDRYGLTVRPDGTHLLWLDEPDVPVGVLPA